MYSLKCPLSCPILMVSLAVPLAAVEVADLAGTWHLADLETPVSLREMYYNVDTGGDRTSLDSSDYAGRTGLNEWINFVYYPDPLFTETRSFSINGSGAVSGGETGQILSISSNRILYSDGTETTTVYSNTVGDILLASGRDPDRQSQTVCLKQPGTLTTSELAGEWYVLSMINRADITTHIVDGRLADTYYVADPSVADGNITVNNNGSFSGLFSGTLDVTSPSNITATTGDGSVSFKCNASKNLMLSTPGDANEAETIVLVRKPVGLATADLAGTWRISAIQIPTTLTESYTNESSEASREADNSDSANEGERLVDVYHTDPFEIQRLQVLVDPSGTFTGSVSGSLAAAGSAVSVTVDGEVLTLHPNADKTFMAGINQFSDSHELIYCIKVSDNRAGGFEQEADVKPIVTADKFVVSWNSGNNVVLEAIDGDTWTPVEGSEDADAFGVDIHAGGTRIFRVRENTVVPD